jgi:hypothetical protein
MVKPVYTLLCNRSSLSSRDSINSIIQYAQLSDNRLTAKVKFSYHSSLLMAGLIYCGIGAYVIHVLKQP